MTGLAGGTVTIITIGPGGIIKVEKQPDPRLLSAIHVLSASVGLPAAERDQIVKAVLPMLASRPAVPALRFDPLAPN